MDILFALLAFFFMMLFLSTLRALINKDEVNSSFLCIVWMFILGLYICFCTVGIVTLTRKESLMKAKGRRKMFRDAQHAWNPAPEEITLCSRRMC
ncbi:hypothetical protein [Paenibacillus sp. Soil787]|uniref:hypothetical protein n=1 Tax=Paenibacillus sp. Soil787 TaxID=1736411 RepID=UPI0006FBF771|nr:hypothetical protein [Paenibacillus sp. Soil787]KRF44028.1 hypothetical protein ASG93_03720 [Paenibacillus sp. Soil787]